MNSEDYLKTYRKFLRDNYNAERAVKEKAYLYSDLKHYGIPSGLSKKFVIKYKKEIVALNKAKTLQLVKLLWKQPLQIHLLFSSQSYL